MTSETSIARPSLPLLVGVSTRALFDLEEEHRIFEREGVVAYAALQLEREKVVLRPGAAFDVVHRLLSLNAAGDEKNVEVILLSKNSPDLSLRALHSAEKLGIQVEHGSFTSGRSVAPYVNAWGVDLFLSNDDSDVRAAVEGGTASAKLGAPPAHHSEDPADEVRIAFDGDAVVFSPESDQIYATQGLQAFLAHERQNAQVPMKSGPFGNFLNKLAVLRERFMRPNGTSRVRIAIVTARNAPAHERVVHTLRAWGTPADEAHFVGRHAKAPFLKAFGAHIFFDDQEKHVLGAATVVAAGLVPGPHSPDKPIIPAG
ncbi:5'-nucleotidase [Magnetospirillum aberrantis]|uniref:5'-nucleotidase n=1 Tax=Magnetospirillum aberrantis SpK TaxID=908842 RepID=A0A7C9UXZ2_9PROT|nr:5'-nucleotidase [Magnetospirillum aberrantis]NFV81410.1 5'-nucleotidase [Magnetospirillum aberrantis SpK]